MSDWRAAKSLLALRDQCNKRWPKRSKDSDGLIGDAAHASRASDHDPWIKDGNTGIVTAMDITHDPKSGCDSYILAELLRAARDSRVKYLISNRKICSGSDQDHAAWVWRPYHGANPHNHHIHISVKSDKAHYDDDRAWSLDGIVEAVNLPDLDSYQPMPKTLRSGDNGDLVKKMQGLLAKSYPDLNIDGKFGPETFAAVKLFQTKNKLVVDGVVGPQVWSDLLWGKEAPTR